MTSPESVRPALVPQDLRLANLRRVVQELRSEPSLSRAELARRTGMAVPTVHRLVSDLEANELVDVEAIPVDDGRLGRPPTAYRFRRESGLVAGVDVGNETTRVALADLGGSIQAFRSQPTTPSRSGLVSSLTTAIDELLLQATVPLVGVGVGIASVVHPQTGELCNPPEHQEWAGLRMADELSAQLGCEVAVDQDDHLAAMAEFSNAGTAPGAESLVVLQIGRGVGVGYALEGRAVAGTVGRFGRIASWPVTHAEPYLPGPTLVDSLPTGGLVAQYRNRGGTGPVTDGNSLSAAARDGDAKAHAVLMWAADQIADLVCRFDALLAPDVIVFGGGLSGSFDVLEERLRARVPSGVDLRPSVLGDKAVVAGAVVTGSHFIGDWLMQQLQRS